MFLNDGKVAFSLFKILFKFFRINFCSCVSSRLFCCVVFGWVGFPFSEVGSFWTGCFCLLIFDVSGNVFLLSWSFIFLVYFNYFEFWKPTLLHYRSNLISESLTSCLKIRKFLSYLHNSFPVSSLCRVTPKIAVECKLVVFPSSCFPLLLLLLLLLLLFYFQQVFHTSVNWLSFKRISVTARLLRSPGHFSVFCPILAMLLLEWSLFALRFPTFPALFFPSSPIIISITVILELVSVSPSCSIVLLQGLSIYLSFCFLSILLSDLPRRQSPLFSRFSFFYCFL